MSNILIIKHGSLGDIAQASGAIQDIFENHKYDKLYLLTTKSYFDLFKKNPFITDVILDKRLSRFNLIYLYSLMRSIKKFKIHLEQIFIKEFYFLIQIKITGRVQKQLYPMIKLKKNLMKVLCLIDLNIN